MKYAYIDEKLDQPVLLILILSLSIFNNFIIEKMIVILVMFTLQMDALDPPRILSKQVVLLNQS